MPVNALSPSDEYALRAVICIAAGGDRWIPARDVAEIASVPPAYLSKVLRRLVMSGILLARKGHHGGFRLARPVAEIRVSSILECTEGWTGDEHCAFGWSRCNSRSPCALHDVYGDLRTRLIAWAETHTLADIDMDRLRGPPA